MSYQTEGPSEGDLPQPQRPAVGYDATKRPWTVTFAALIAFVIAALLLLGAIGAFMQAKPGMPAAENLMSLPVAGNIAFAGLLLWCGLSVLRGATSRGLSITAIALLAVNVAFDVNLVMSGARVGVLTVCANIVVAILAVAVIALLMHHSSRRFFRGRGDTAI